MHSSYTVSKNRLSGSTKGEIELEMYREVVESFPSFYWMETVNSDYKLLQEQRASGISDDNILPRERMECCFIPGEIKWSNTIFYSSYDTSLQCCTIQFTTTPKLEGLLMLKEFIEQLSAKLYHGLKLMEIDAIIAKANPRKR